MLAIMFSGQGIQQKGMGGELFSLYNNISSISDEILGYSIQDICINNLNNELSNTLYAQPAIFIVNHLHYLAYIEAGGQQADFYLGHSLGEYNALVASGSLSFEDALITVKSRANAMASIKSSSMTVLVGEDAERLTKTLITKFDIADIYIANINSYDQIVVAGTLSALDKIESIIKQHYPKFYSKRLPVSGAFHSPLMAPCLNLFDTKKLLDVSDGIEKVISNINAKPHDKNGVLSALESHITNPVVWKESIYNLKSQGVNNFLEIGEATILTNLVKRIERSSEQDDVWLDNYSSVMNRNLSSLDSQIYRVVVSGAGFGVGTDESIRSVSKNFHVKSFLSVKNSEFNDVFTQVQTLKEDQLDFGISISRDEYGQPELQTILNYIIDENINSVEFDGFFFANDTIIAFLCHELKRHHTGIKRPVHALFRVIDYTTAKRFIQPLSATRLDSLIDNNVINDVDMALLRKVPLASSICLDFSKSIDTFNSEKQQELNKVIALRDDIYRKNGIYTSIGLDLFTMENVSEIPAGVDFISLNNIVSITQESRYRNDFIRQVVLSSENNNFTSIPCPGSLGLQVNSLIDSAFGTGISVISSLQELIDSHPINRSEVMAILEKHELCGDDSSPIFKALINIDDNIDRMILINICRNIMRNLTESTYQDSELGESPYSLFYGSGEILKYTQFLSHMNLPVSHEISLNDLIELIEPSSPPLP